MSITLSGLASVLAVQENCSLNCVETERNGNKLTTRVYNKAGKTTKVITTRLPKYADYKRTLTSNVMSADDGGTVKIASVTYNTASGLIIVTAYIYYDDLENIINVRVVVTKFPKPI